MLRSGLLTVTFLRKKSPGKTSKSFCMFMFAKWEDSFGFCFEKVPLLPYNALFRHCAETTRIMNNKKIACKEARTWIERERSNEFFSRKDWWTAFCFVEWNILTRFELPRWEGSYNPTYFRFIVIASLAFFLETTRLPEWTRKLTQYILLYIEKPSDCWVWRLKISVLKGAHTRGKRNLPPLANRFHPVHNDILCIIYFVVR